MFAVINYFVVKYQYRFAVSFSNRLLLCVGCIVDFVLHTGLSLSEARLGYVLAGGSGLLRGTNHLNTICS